MEVSVDEEHTRRRMAGEMYCEIGRDGCLAFAGDGREDTNHLRSRLLLGNVDQGPDVAPSEADLKTAQHLGARVANVTHELVLGRQAKAKLA